MRSARIHPVTAIFGLALSAVSCTTEPGDPGPPALLMLFSAPSGSQQSGLEFDRPSVIKVADLNSQVMPLRGIRISVALTSGEGTLSGVTTLATADTGAVFDDLFITGTAGEKILTFSSPSLISAKTTINLTAPAQGLVIVSGDEQAGLRGGPLESSLGVHLIGSPIVEPAESPTKAAVEAETPDQ